jgi:hypothetical protein
VQSSLLLPPEPDCADAAATSSAAMSQNGAALALAAISNLLGFATV